jgi:hypothetical protein
VGELGGVSRPLPLVALAASPFGAVADPLGMGCFAAAWAAALVLAVASFPADQDTRRSKRRSAPAEGS